jgi:hypothetical protein
MTRAWPRIMPIAACGLSFAGASIAVLQCVSSQLRTNEGGSLVDLRWQCFISVLNSSMDYMSNHCNTSFKPHRSPETACLPGPTRA